MQYLTIMRNEIVQESNEHNNVLNKCNLEHATKTSSVLKVCNAINVLFRKTVARNIFLRIQCSILPILVFP